MTRREKFRIAFGVLLLFAIGVTFWLVLPRWVAVHCGVKVTFDVAAKTNTNCCVVYMTEAGKGYLELMIPAGNGEAECFIPTQIPLRKISMIAPGVRSGVVRLVGSGNVMRAVSFASLPADLNFKPGWVPYWRGLH